MNWSSLALRVSASDSSLSGCLRSIHFISTLTVSGWERWGLVFRERECSGSPVSWPLGLTGCSREQKGKNSGISLLSGEAEIEDFKHYFGELVISIHSFRNYLEMVA